MSIATEIERLSGVRTDIFTSLTNKGVEVPETATFSSCPALIDSIPAGGQVDGYINPDYKYGASFSLSSPFTATQEKQNFYSDDYISSGMTLSSNSRRSFLITLGDLKKIATEANGSATFVGPSEYSNTDMYWTTGYNESNIYGCKGYKTTSSNSSVAVYPPSALLSAYSYVKNYTHSADSATIGLVVMSVSYGDETRAFMTMKEVTAVDYAYPDRPMTIEGTYVENSENTMFMSAYVDSSNLTAYKLGIKLNQSANYPVNGSNTGSGFSQTYGLWTPTNFKDYAQFSGLGDMARSAFVVTPQPSIDEVAPNSAYSFTFGETTVTTGEMFGNAFNTPAE